MTKSSKKAQTIPTPAPAHHTIQSFEVVGGYLRGLVLPFAPGLNCIIGGRGAGKTTVLELIRFVLGLNLRPRQKGVVQHGLESGGRVRLRVRTRLGAEYTAERSWNEPPTVLNEQSEATNLSFDRPAIFTADVYSQSEIEEIALNPGFQLRLLDRFVEEDVNRIQAEIRRVQADLSRNAAELIQLDEEIGDLEVVTSQAEEVDEKLQALQKEAGPDAKVLTAAHERKTQREKERAAFAALHGDLGKVRTDMEIQASSHVRRLEARVDPDLATGANKKVFGLVGEQVRELIQAIEKSTAAIARATEETDRVLAEAEEALTLVHVKQDEEYRQLLERSKEERERADMRAATQKLHAEVSGALKELELKRRERRELEAEREQLASVLSERRDERFRFRKTVTEKLSVELEPESITVDIKLAGNREAYGELLGTVLREAGVKHPNLLERLTDRASPTKLVDLIRTEDVEGFADISGIRDEDKARRAVEALAKSARLYEIEAFELEDLPLIHLKDGGKKKLSADLSTGQRCTTILLPQWFQPIPRPADQPDQRFHPISTRPAVPPDFPESAREIRLEPLFAASIALDEYPLSGSLSGSNRFPDSVVRNPDASSAADDSQ